MNEMNDSIAAQHFLPDRDAWNDRGDLRQRIQEQITVPIRDPVNIHYHHEIEPGQRRPNFGFFHSSWYHFDLVGVLTEEIFHEELTQGIKNFADQVNALGEFRPVRIGFQPSVKYSIAFHDWLQGEHSFDIRAFIVFGQWEEPSTKLPTAGLMFALTTLIAYDPKSEAFIPPPEAPLEVSLAIRKKLYLTDE